VLAREVAGAIVMMPFYDLSQTTTMKCVSQRAIYLIFIVIFDYFCEFPQ